MEELLAPNDEGTAGLVRIFYWAVGGAVSLLLALLVHSSIRERHRRATLVSLLLLVAFAAVWFVGPLPFGSPPALLWSSMGIVLLGALLFFLPLGAGPRLRRRDVSPRVDERDVIFAREECAPGSEKYAQYYAAHPERRRRDDRIRALPEILEAGGRLYVPELAARIERDFEAVRRRLREVDGEVATEQRSLTPGQSVAGVKALARELGAADVGIARLDPAYVYSHVGRGPEPWGAPIENDHPWAICFVAEMDSRAVAAAPSLPITVETAKCYLDLARVSITLAQRIRAWGYRARAHISGSNYQVLAVALAHDAGLGELGRCGYLITRRFGPRARLGIVTTDLPLVADRPVSLGVQDFCRRCLKCAENCPAGAIPRGERRWVRGVEKWPLEVENCVTYWRWLGTDCGLCMKVCPFAHPRGLIHDLVRIGIRHSPFARAVSLWADDFVYGRKIAYERIMDGSLLD